MADDAPDVTADITPDDFDGEQDTTKTTSSVVEDKKPEAVKPEEPAKGDDTPAVPEVPEAKPGDAKVDEDKAEEPQSKADERKAQLNTEIRDLVAQRNALKEQVAKANAEVYQPATEDELVQDGMNATDARVEALRQRIEVKEFNDRVADAQLTIESESQRVLNDFPVFNPDSQEFDQDLANEAADLLKANLILDPNTNQVIGSNVSPYQLYKTLAKASGISAAKGQVKGQQATEKMLANADTTGSAAPPAKPKDPLAELWAEEL